MLSYIMEDGESTEGSVASLKVRASVGCLHEIGSK